MRRDELKDKIYLEAAEKLAELSTCPRRQFAALLVNSDGLLRGHGYNGTISGSSNLCGGDSCLRDTDGIKSGTRPDVGCIHAEVNMLQHSDREDLIGGTVYVGGPPCPLCAKYLIQAGIARVVVRSKGYSTHDGLDMLRDHLVLVTEM